ncbi:hypothetical protein [Pseudomonas kilonensis]|uniref:hypothetical protein n=1 Tax=Pseudomonas kilonensis TaxID=132476 RepID=UPI001183823B|nr:hypothetical protein [Pseudomonas kilonensis]
MSEPKNTAPSGATDCAQIVSMLDTAKPADSSGTQALTDFLQVVGSGVADLNTIAVGLAAIGQDHEKPEGLNISWAPKDPLVAARKARKAAVHAAMVVTAEALAQYIRAVTKLPRFQRLTTEWNSRKPKPSASERFSELAKLLFTPICQVKDTTDYDTRFRSCCVMLLIHWRNRHVHTDSNAELTHQEKQVIQAHEERIRDAYAGLDIDQLFGDFKHNRPTLKEATTLIAMTIQEVRAMDEAVYICNDAADVQAWLDHYKLPERIDKIKRESKPEKQRASILRMLHTHAPRLKPWYEKFIPDTLIATP